MTRYIVVFFIALFMACSTQPKHYIGGRTMVESIFSIEGRWNIHKQKSQTFAKGNLENGGQNASYEYRNDADRGPITAMESFQDGFKGQYYSRFFEIIHIDEKLHRKYVDSVRIEAILDTAQFSQKYLMPCTVCKKVARLSFRKRVYYFPFFIDEESENVSQKYEITTDTIDDHYRKIYISKDDSASSGVYMRPIYNCRQSPKLSVLIQSPLDADDKKTILSSIRMIKIDEKSP